MVLMLAGVTHLVLVLADVAEWGLNTLVLGHSGCSAAGDCNDAHM